MFTYNRPGMVLDGIWKFCPDPMQRCRRQQWWKNSPKENSAFPSWDPEGLWNIVVPGTWKTQFETLQWYDGHAVYLRDFTIQRLPEGKEAYLCFDGIVYAAEVYLNGHLVGQHEWGYSPFCLRVTECLRRKNRLFVLVDNVLKADRVPGEIFDWNNDGGIVNSVKLVWVPSVHVENFRVQTHLETGEVSVEVEIFLQSRDTEAREKVAVRFPELKWQEVVTVAAGGSGRVHFRAPREGVELWNPGHPRLYRIELATRAETIHDEVGLREVKTRGSHILLNGNPLRLYGLCVHSEFKGTGRTATAKGIDQMLKRARDLGVNFLRCAHYPFAEIFGRALDRAGLLWWEETPAYWLLNMHEEGQIRRACGILEETIRRDWNRAGLIIWSISNECCYRNPDNLAANNYPYWFRAAALIRRLDPSRLISCAEAGNRIAVQETWRPEKADDFQQDGLDASRWRPGHADEWYRLIDVLSANLYLMNPGEAQATYRRYVEMTKPFNKPVILSEFGSMSLRDTRVPRRVLGNEARHAAILREAYRVFARLPDLTGYCPWCLVDTRAPTHWRWYNQGKGVFRYGLLDEEWREKRTVYRALKKSIAVLKRRYGESQMEQRGK